MKYLSEYRSPELAGTLLREIHRITTREWHIMEVCGGQTHSLIRNGILPLLPSSVKMIHGPGCPVCVTPVSLIDQAVRLALERQVILCSFGDMIRVPGSGFSLLEAKARGADIRVLYSPLEAVKTALENPDREVVFFAVGFETTAPANALSVIHAKRQGVRNYSILSSQVLVPPAMEAVLSDAECRVDGFLAAGHVCTIMGLKEYVPISEKYKVPIVVTGFEPVDLLEGIWMTVRQLELGEYRVENQYARVVLPEGNQSARNLLAEVFRTGDREWRGIGFIPSSGLELKDDFSEFDAAKKFQLLTTGVEEKTSCLAGDVMKGKIKPIECPHFGKECIPSRPLGAPMVSSEGACAAYYHFTLAGNYVPVL